MCWAGLVAALLAAGCEPSVIEGTVADVKGDVLPGVGVGAVGDTRQVVTDARGRYALPFEPGALQLVFIKTGYTPGRLDLVVEGARTVQATTVVLWPLPTGKGVHLFEDFRYRQLVEVTSQSYEMAGGDLVQGVKVTPDLVTQTETPMLLCFKMPHYDVRFCRLRQVAVPSPESPDPAYAQEVWASEDTLPALLEPIDEPEGSLVEMRLEAPLTPGVYAVHWGALDTHAPTDPRAYLFRVAEPGSEEAAANSDNAAPLAE